MNLLLSDDWAEEFDDCDDFYEGPYCGSYQSFFDDLMTPVLNTRKIVELIDTGCDARSSRLNEKNNKFTKSPSRSSNYRESKIKKSVVSKEKVARSSAGDTQAATSQYLPTKGNADSSKKNSLDKRIVSSSTFNVAGRQSNGRNDEEDFEDFEDSDDIESREMQSRRRFTDRAVDSDCLSISSRSSIDNIEAASSTTVNLRRTNLKVRTQETNPSKAERTKKLTKSNESVEDKLPFAKNPRAKSSRSSRTGGLSSAVRNSRQKENGRSRINFKQSGRKLESLSRTIIKDKKVKINKERSEIPRPVMREGNFTVKRDNGRFAKEPFLEGSRIPVWQGRLKKSKMASNFDDSWRKIAKDQHDVGGIFKLASRVEQKYSEGELRKNEKNRKIIVEDDSDENETVSARSLKIGESVEWQRVKFEGEEIRGQSKVKDTEEIEGDVEDRGEDEIKGIVKAQGRIENNEIAENKVTSENKVEDQSKSDLWSQNYEEAFAKGRAVGLRVYRMAKAAREERKREFRKYGFEDYKRRPREKPQEIVDIAVTLLEKVLDDGKENYYKRN